MDAEDREVFREMARRIDGLIDGANGLTGSVNQLVEGVRIMGLTLAEGQQALQAEMRGMSADIRGMSADIRALVARIDALIRGRDNGGAQT